MTNLISLSSPSSPLLLSHFAPQWKQTPCKKTHLMRRWRLRELDEPVASSTCANSAPIPCLQQQHIQDPETQNQLCFPELPEIKPTAARLHKSTTKTTYVNTCQLKDHNPPWGLCIRFSPFISKMQQQLPWNAIAQQLRVAQKWRKTSALHNSLVMIASLNPLNFNQRWVTAGRAEMRQTQVRAEDAHRLHF